MGHTLCVVHMHAARTCSLRLEHALFPTTCPACFTPWWSVVGLICQDREGRTCQVEVDIDGVVALV